MSDVAQLTSRLAQIDGIESYLLTDRNGAVLAHNVKSPDDLTTMTIIGGTGAESIMAAIGCSQMRYLAFNRMDQRNFLIFTLEQFLLGVQQISGTDDQLLAAEIIHFLAEQQPDATAPDQQRSYS